uniref:Uncharacterized protein n=1 Tax=mine drainage metagenome TaxID=410659 RepID=E6QBL9_9ZZZZ
MCVNNLRCMIGYLVGLVYRNRLFFCWYGGDFLEILLRCEPLIIISLAIVLGHCASGEQLHNNKRHDYFSYPCHLNFLIMQYLYVTKDGIPYFFEPGFTLIA